jgi:DNA polymerase III epsilon subunit-like protein
MLALIYDTETNGFPLYKERSDDPRQPHIVEIAAKLVDLERGNRVIRTLHEIVKPDGWEIPEEAANVHGISQEYATAHGTDELSVVINFYHRFFCHADVVIGHNVAFDNRIIRIAIKRHMDDIRADSFKAGNFYCTMHTSRRVMKDQGSDLKKPPKLEEAFLFFTGNALENAHSALVDVDATLDVYRYLNNRISIEDQI